MKGVVLGLAGLVGTGVAIPLLQATVRHYWARHLARREEKR